jgi:hypothetical protein
MILLLDVKRNVNRLPFFLSIPIYVTVVDGTMSQSAYSDSNPRPLHY